MVQVYSAKIVATLKANGIVAYSVHIVLLNFAQTFLRFLHHHDHTFLGPLFSLTTTDKRDEREEKLENSDGGESSGFPKYNALPVSMEKSKKYGTTGTP